MLAAVTRGAEILRGGGAALDSVIATVVALEDDPLFNAGYGSLLTTAGRVEMDAAVMSAAHVRGAAPSINGVRSRTAATAAIGGRTGPAETRAGGVVLVSRVRNPIMLARAVMDRTPHLLIGGAGAERIARLAGIPLCRPESLITQRARERWLATREQALAAEMEQTADDGRGADQHGTVGAVAIDGHGDIAAATSTGGYPGKLPGRVGDSALIGAGLFATTRGAASATGAGEAIMSMALCRQVVSSLVRMPAQAAANRAITQLHAATGAQAGVIIVDDSGRLGYAHNAAAMDVALFDTSGGVRHRLADSIEIAGANRRSHRGKSRR
jgi:L-asparaginase / beta-aspartyl-peptidase